MSNILKPIDLTDRAIRRAVFAVLDGLAAEHRAATTACRSVALPALGPDVVPVRLSTLSYFGSVWPNPGEAPSGTVRPRERFKLGLHRPKSPICQCRDACVLAAAERAGNALYSGRVTSNLAAVERNRWRPK
jgi:hypothetical protein